MAYPSLQAVTFSTPRYRTEMWRQRSSDGLRRSSQTQPRRRFDRTSRWWVYRHSTRTNVKHDFQNPNRHICKVSDNNVRICNCRLHIYFFVIPCNRMYCIWMLSAFHRNYLFKFNFVNILSRRYIGRKDWHVRGRDSMEPTWINEIIHTEEKSMRLSEKGAFVTMTTLRPSGIWMSLNRCY